MRRLGIIVGILVILAIGGGLTTLLQDGGVGNILPFLQQSSNPEASPMEATSWQTEQFFLMVGFILFNMIGIGLTIAAIMWFLNRQVTIVNVEETEADSA